MNSITNILDSVELDLESMGYVYCETCESFVDPETFPDSHLGHLISIKYEIEDDQMKETEYD